MYAIHYIKYLMLIVLLSTSGQTPADGLKLNFDDKLEPLQHWISSATRGKPAQWQVKSSEHALSGQGVLQITKINDHTNSNFNIYWSPKASFHNGTIEVNVRAEDGKIDQGGGLIWRAIDENNYYITRYNPLERNLRLYFVKNGKREMLVDVPDLTVATGTWFSIRMRHINDRIEVWFDGVKHIETMDNTFNERGGVGFWAKADARSLFDDFRLSNLD